MDRVGHPVVTEKASQGLRPWSTFALIPVRISIIISIISLNSG